MDRTGKVVIPPRFTWASVFSGGVAKVREKASFGSGLRFINKKGEVFSEVDYDDVSLFVDGLALAVTKKGIFGRPVVTYIEPSGKAVLKFDDLGATVADWSSSPVYIFTLTWNLTPRIYAGSGSEGLAAVRVQGDAFMKAWKEAK